MGIQLIRGYFWPSFGSLGPWGRHRKLLGSFGLLLDLGPLGEIRKWGLKSIPWWPGWVWESIQPLKPLLLPSPPESSVKGTY